MVGIDSKSTACVYNLQRYLEVFHFTSTHAVSEPGEVKITQDFSRITVVFPDHRISESGLKKIQMSRVSSTFFRFAIKT